MRQCAAITLPGISLRGIWPWPAPMDFPHMEEELLEEYMEQYGKEGHALPKELIQYAVECGGSDNITAAVIYNG